MVLCAACQLDLFCFLVMSVQRCLFGLFVFLSQNGNFKDVERYKRDCQINLQVIL